MSPRKKFVATVSFLIAFISSAHSMQSIGEERQPIIHIVTFGRTCSTLLMRAIQAQGDYQKANGGKETIIYNEPGAAAYAHKHTPEICDEWLKPDAIHDNKLLAQHILEHSRKNPVCVKGTGGPAKDFLSENPDYVNQSNVFFIFLIRDPGDVISSLYRATRKFVDDSKLWINPNDVKETHQLVAKTRKNIKILFTQDLLANPAQHMRQIMEFAGLKFSKAAMQWPSLGRDFDGKVWHDCKKKDKIDIFHSSARDSTHFKQTNKYNKKAGGIPTFAEAEEQYRPTMIQAYNEFKASYDYFVASASST